MYENLAIIYDNFTDDIDYDKWEKDIYDAITEYSKGNTESVADLACGTGSITCRLAKRGYKVTGIDVSEEMLIRAGENMRKSGVHFNLVKQDISKFRLHKRVDAIVCACDGINYLTVDGQFENFICCCRENLKQDGILIFDVSSYEKLKNTLGNNSYFDIRDDACIFWQNSLEDKIVTMELTIFLKDDDGRYTRKTEVQKQRIYSQKEIKAAMTDFEILDMKSVSYDNNNSDKRLQFICRLTKEKK